MSHSDLFKNLFRNAREGDCSAPLLGHAPEWLDGGRVVYNGPVGRWDHERATVKQWFDGMGLLQTFTFEGGVVHLKKRFLR